MIGQAVASRERHAGFVQRHFGVCDIHVRHKWNVIWDHMQEAPDQQIRVADAGCGEGLWTLEIAARRPHWVVHGFDRNEQAIQKAERRRNELGLENASFECENFLTYQPHQRFHVVLSIASAHYLCALGKGRELFTRFREWLEPRGRLVMLVPRHRSETPYLDWLPQPDKQWGFRKSDLLDLLVSSQFPSFEIDPYGGTASAIAKQSSLLRSRMGGMLAPLYPLELALLSADRVASSPIRSLFYVVCARA